MSSQSSTDDDFSDDDIFNDGEEWQCDGCGAKFLFRPPGQCDVDCGACWLEHTLSYSQSYFDGIHFYSSLKNKCHFLIRRWIRQQPNGKYIFHSSCGFNILRIIPVLQTNASERGDPQS